MQHWTHGIVTFPDYGALLVHVREVAVLQLEKGTGGGDADMREYVKARMSAGGAGMLGASAVAPALGLGRKDSKSDMSMRDTDSPVDGGRGPEVEAKVRLAAQWHMGGGDDHAAAIKLCRHHLHQAFERCSIESNRRLVEEPEHARH